MADFAFMLDDLAKLPDAVVWLESQPTFRQQRQARALFDPGVIYKNYYEALLGAIVPS